MGDSYVYCSLRGMLGVLNTCDGLPVLYDLVPANTDERVAAESMLYHQLQNMGRNLERLLARTLFGLTARVTLNVTCLVLKRLLARQFGCDIQSFSISP